MVQTSWVLLKKLLVVLAWKLININFQSPYWVIFQDITSASCVIKPSTAKIYANSGSICWGKSRLVKHFHASKKKAWFLQQKWRDKCSQLMKSYVANILKSKQQKRSYRCSQYAYLNATVLGFIKHYEHRGFILKMSLVKWTSRYRIKRNSNQRILWVSIM